MDRVDGSSLHEVADACLADLRRNPSHRTPDVVERFRRMARLEEA